MYVCPPGAFFVGQFFWAIFFSLTFFINFFLVFFCEIAFLYPIDLVEGHAMELTHVISVAQWSAPLDADLEVAGSSPGVCKKALFWLC